MILIMVRPAGPKEIGYASKLLHDEKITSKVYKISKETTP